MCLRREIMLRNIGRNRCCEHAAINHRFRFALKAVMRRRDKRIYGVDNWSAGLFRPSLHPRQRLHLEKIRHSALKGLTPTFLFLSANNIRRCARLKLFRHLSEQGRGGLAYPSLYTLWGDTTIVSTSSMYCLYCGIQFAPGASGSLGFFFASRLTSFCCAQGSEHRGDCSARRGRVSDVRL